MWNSFLFLHVANRAFVTYGNRRDLTVSEERYGIVLSDSALVIHFLFGSWPNGVKMGADALHHLFGGR
jgi:hypothetical protein